MSAKNKNIKKQEEPFAFAEDFDDIDNTLAKIPYDIHCGRHSGFPSCCIKFFITKWVWVCTNTRSKFVKDYWKAQDKHGPLGPGYIACPECLKKGSFVKVKKCPKSCEFKKLIWGENWQQQEKEKRKRKNNKKLDSK